MKQMNVGKRGCVSQIYLTAERTYLTAGFTLVTLGPMDMKVNITMMEDIMGRENVE